MENRELSMVNDGVLQTNDPAKVVDILNNILKDPDSSIIMEPTPKDYWVFFFGGVNSPIVDSAIILKERKETGKGHPKSNKAVKGNWASYIIDIDGLFAFSVWDALDNIKNRQSIKTIIQNREGTGKLHLYYKK